MSFLKPQQHPLLMGYSIFQQTFLISNIFAGVPKTCTGTTAAILLPVNLLKTLSPFRNAI